VGGEGEVEKEGDKKEVEANYYKAPSGSVVAEDMGLCVFRPIAPNVCFFTMVRSTDLLAPSKTVTKGWEEALDVTTELHHMYHRRSDVVDSEVQRVMADAMVSQSPDGETERSRLPNGIARIARSLFLLVGSLFAPSL